MAAKEAAAKLSVVQILKQAGPDDLAEVDARIAELQGELDSLSVIRKALDVKVNGKPERKTRSPSAKGAAIQKGKRRAEIIRYLEHAGAKKPAIIAADTGVPLEEVLEFVKGDPFVKQGDFITLKK